MYQNPCVSLSGMNYTVFFHYTDEYGKNAIVQSMCIKASRRNPKGRDVLFGEGVYGTTMDPDLFSKQELAKNNYDTRAGFWENLMDIGRVDYAIKILLPISSLKLVKHKTRDILIHKGDIDLRKYRFTVIKVRDEDSEDSEESDWLP
ncbi:uncharacterized protein LOC124119544 [Haliotis rufescens]|uniref:uncharacterized protein LOC124119544 n=1 Tax=Haliotis rufescens TaxID=6454 RepID=UPI00201F4223|nr:uncharacterized protein LOC124119544 [Haliotis rufescens]